MTRYRGTSRQIEHNARHPSRPLELPFMGVGGERVFGSAVAENLRHGASNVRQEVLADCGHYVSEERPEELAACCSASSAGRDGLCVTARPAAYGAPSQSAFMR